MGPRVLVLLLITALGAAAWWIMREVPTEDEGLVVHVYVQDQDGKPLAKAQIEKIYAQERLAVDAQGYVKLTHLPLRLESEPSPAELLNAIRVYAHFYALRKGFEPEVRVRADGSWEMRYALHAHGILWLRVGDTHLGECKAYPEADKPLRRWEAIEATQVARPGGPVSYRVYPGLERIAVRLEGLPDKDGAVAIATRRLFVRPPPPGHTIDKRIEAEKVQPIIGTVLWEGETRPPTLGGRVHVAEIGDGEERIALGTVPIDQRGSFVVRTAGSGVYQLRLECAFLDCGDPLAVSGGDVVTRQAIGLRPWLEIHHPGVDATKRKGRFTFAPFHDIEESARPPFRIDGERICVPLPHTGSYEVLGRVLPTDEKPPLETRYASTASINGANPITVNFQPVPYRTVIVKVKGMKRLKRGGGTVRLNDREKSLIPRLREEVRFKHVPAWKTMLYITFDDEWAFSMLSPIYDIKPGEERVIEHEVQRGGMLALRPPASWASTETKPIYVSWPLDTDHAGRVNIPIQFDRRGAAPVWESVEVFPVGLHDAMWSEQSFWDWDKGVPTTPEEVKGAVRLFRVEIKLEETTVVSLEEK